MKETKGVNNDQAAALVHLACRNKFPENEKRAEPAKPRERCYVYWDNVRFQIGKTKNINYSAFEWIGGGAVIMEFYLPKILLETLKRNKPNKTDADLGGRFIWDRQSEIYDICGFWLKDLP